MKNLLRNLLSVAAFPFRGWDRKYEKNHWRFIRLYETDFSEFIKAYKGLTYNDYDEVNKGSLMTWCNLKLMNSETLSPKDKILVEHVEKILIGEVSLHQAEEMQRVVKSITKP